MAEQAIPYKILVLAPFAPVPEEKFKPTFIPIDLYSIDEAVEKISPALYLPLSAPDCPDGAVTLKFNQMKDFKARSIQKVLPGLSSESPEKKSGPAIVPEKKAASPENTTAIDDILSMVDAPGVDAPASETPDDPGASGAATSSAMAEIFSAAEFKQMESAWRGLAHLIKKARIKGHKTISVEIAPVSGSSLGNTLDIIMDFPADQVPNLLVIDLGFDNTIPSLELLEKVTSFADNMMLPVCIWIKHQFFKIEKYQHLEKLSYLKHYLEDVSFAKFKKMRQNPGASWVIPCCNRFAVRPPNEFENETPLVSPVFGIATLCAMAVQNSGWPMGFTRYNENRLKDLAMIEDSEHWNAATEALLSEDKIAQLVEAGFTPVVGMKNKDVAIVPKAASMAGDSIKFHMFINRIIEALMHLKKDVSGETAVAQRIENAINQLFAQTDHPLPQNTKVVQNTESNDGATVYEISFTPPESVISGTGKIAFSFTW